MIGKKITHKGETLYSPETYDIGIVYGCIYKDEDAFKNNTKEVCYIPEYAFKDAEKEIIDGVTYYHVNGYSRKNLEELIEGEVDNEGNAIDIEYFFDNLIWAFPETYLLELV